MKAKISSEVLLRGETTDFRAIKYAKIRSTKPPIAPAGNGGKISQTTARGMR